MPGHERCVVGEFAAGGGNRLHPVHVLGDHVDGGGQCVGLLEKRGGAHHDFDPFHVIKINWAVKELRFVDVVEVLAVDQQGDLLVVVGVETPNACHVLQILMKNREAGHRLKQLTQTAVTALGDNASRIDVNAAGSFVDLFIHAGDGRLSGHLDPHQVFQGEILQGGAGPCLGRGRHWVRAGRGALNEERNRRQQGHQPRERDHDSAPGAPGIGGIGRVFHRVLKVADRFFPVPTVIVGRIFARIFGLFCCSQWIATLRFAFQERE